MQIRRHRKYSRERTEYTVRDHRGCTYSAKVRERERNSKTRGIRGSASLSFSSALSFFFFFFFHFAARCLVTASVKIETRNGCIERSIKFRGLKTVTMIYKRHAVLKHKRFSSSCGNAAFHCALYRALYRSNVRGRSANTTVLRFASPVL